MIILSRSFFPLCLVTSISTFFYYYFHYLDGNYEIDLMSMNIDPILSNTGGGGGYTQNNYTQQQLSNTDKRMTKSKSKKSMGFNSNNGSNYNNNSHSVNIGYGESSPSFGIYTDYLVFLPIVCLFLFFMCSVYSYVPHYMLYICIWYKLTCIHILSCTYLYLLIYNNTHIHKCMHTLTHINTYIHTCT